MWPEANLKHLMHQKNIIWGSRKSIWGPKKPISESYELNLAIWDLFRLGDSLDGPFIWSMSWEMWPEADLKHFRQLKNTFWGSRKSIWGPKRPIFESYERNLAVWGLSRLGDPLVGPFSWSMSWKMWPEANLKHLMHQKNIIWGSRKSIWGPKRPISESYELNLAIWDLFRLGDSLNGPFIWSMSWEM